MATIDLRNNTEASTGQKKVKMYNESTIHLDDKTKQCDCGAKIKEQDAKIDKILKLLESK
mgnify:FL=1|tara:strand:- start:9 stop:188 length:180 start_codon:yes stop_codon:yes gene_type:complete